MTETPIPDSSELTRQDFTQCDWKDILSTDSKYGCNYWSDNFQASAKEALDNGEGNRAKVLFLLAAVCSMRLTNKSRNEPYEPMWVWNGRSSPTPDWFAESDIGFIADILEDVDEPMLKGRLADLVWLKKTPPEVKFSLEAIDSYRSLDLNSETWATETGDCWKRALTLTRMMGTGAGDRIQEIEADLRAKFDSSASGDKFFSHWLAKTLKEFGLGRNGEETIAEKLGLLAQEFESQGNFYIARDYYGLTGQWYSAAGQGSKQTDTIVAVAEAYVKEAEARMSSDDPSALVAVGFFDKAIQTYREIPRAERQERGIDERIAELIHFHQEAGEQALGEMTTISPPGVDISETARRTRNAVSGKDPMETLNIFASLHQTDAKGLKESAQENLERFVFTALVPRTMLSHDGRVAAKSPGITGPASSDKNETTVWAQMIQDYEIMVSLVVQGHILPALEVMHIEHRFRESDFIAVARNSPAVPPGREELFGKALFNGYECDFATALHLLTPQIEHMVRYRLKSYGVITTHTDHNGIEEERGLSRLVEAQEFKESFGEDLAFEIKALFCDHFGANLRNNISHGLLTSQQCYSADSIYAWWLGLKIAFRTYWAAYQRHIADQDLTEDGPADTNQDPQE